MSPRRFIGFGNFIAAVHDAVFLQALLNTIVMVVGTIAISLVAALQSRWVLIANFLDAASSEPSPSHLFS
jgi:ABC-type sugar transport system permease subunit